MENKLERTAREMVTGGIAGVAIVTVVFAGCYVWRRFKKLAEPQNTDR